MNNVVGTENKLFTCDLGNGMTELVIPIFGDNLLSGMAYAASPVCVDMSDGQKREIVFVLSNLVTKIANKIIYYTIDHLPKSLNDEQNKVAFAFLQRAATFHICNHKISSEGITTERFGKECKLVDEYKTMPLTRSVYEHLAMFYYLFHYTDDQNQREIIWKSWILGSKTNLLKDSGPEYKKERAKAKKEYEDILTILRNNKFVKKCLSNPSGKFEECLNSLAVFSVNRKGPQYVAEKLTYDKAWKYLYGSNIEIHSLLYNYLSMHSHPTYNGLLQFCSQDENIEFPLYESCYFLAYLCRLFMKHFQIDNNVILSSFSERDQEIFMYLSNGMIV